MEFLLIKFDFTPICIDDERTITCLRILTPFVDSISAIDLRPAMLTHFLLDRRTHKMRTLSSLYFTVRVFLFDATYRVWTQPCVTKIVRGGYQCVRQITLHLFVQKQLKSHRKKCVCVCMCVCERDRERERVQYIAPLLYERWMFSHLNHALPKLKPLIWSRLIFASSIPRWKGRARPCFLWSRKQNQFSFTR